MRVAAIYDIHGNLPALEAVLDDVLREDVDRVVVGGDIVPGPMPEASLCALLDLPMPVHFIGGNGEHDVLALERGEEVPRVPGPFLEAMRWVVDDLSSESLAMLATWPATIRLEIPGLGDVLFCHATPRDDNEIFTRLTPQERLLPIFAPTRAGVVLCGHTHMQFDRTVGDVRVVNAGSVGMPFGDPGAYWALLGPAIDLRRTDYDLEAADKRIRATEYPQTSGFDMLKPPREAEMLNVFETAAVR